MRGKWGNEESAADDMKTRRLEWLGHLAGWMMTDFPSLPCSAGYPSPDPDVGLERDEEM